MNYNIDQRVKNAKFNGSNLNFEDDENEENLSNSEVEQTPAFQSQKSDNVFYAFQKMAETQEKQFEEHISISQINYVDDSEDDRKFEEKNKKDQALKVMLQKEKEKKEKELKEKLQKEKELKEKLQKEKEQKELQQKEKELKEKLQKEKELKEKQQKEKELKEKQLKELKEKELKEKQLKESKEKELKDKQQKELKEKESKERQQKEKEQKEKELKEKQQKAYDFLTKKENLLKTQILEDKKRTDNNQIQNQQSNKGIVNQSKITKQVEKAKPKQKEEGAEKRMKTYEFINEKTKVLECIKQWEVTSNYIQEIRQRRQERKEKFTDDIFVPNISSLVINKLNNNPFTNYKDWQRIQDILKKKNITIINNIDPNDIVQGQIGNCYMMSTLSSLAEQPYRIERLVEDQLINETGIYYVRLSIDGIWRYIVIDDFFPVDQNNEILFAKPREENGNMEIWCMMIEKAWSKIFGNYEVTEAGFTKDVLNSFTGAPCENLETEDKDFWNLVIKYSNANYVITAACDHQGMEDNKFTQVGLVPQHAYSILGAYQEGSEKIVEIRNPWGWSGDEWKGKWSDSWSGWTPQLKTKYNITPQNQNDGRFFMNYQDFKEYFDYCTVCKVHDDYYHISTHVNQALNSYSILELTLQEKSNCFLMLYQKYERYFRQDQNEEVNYQYSFVRLLVMKDNKLIKSMCQQERCSYIETELEAGTYQLFIMVDYIDKLYDINFTYYGQQNATLERKRVLDNKKLIQELLCGLLDGHKHSFFENSEYAMTTFIDNTMGCIIQGFTNKTSNAITINKKLKLDNDVISLSPFQQNFDGKISIEPNGQFVLLFINEDIYNNIEVSHLKQYGII